MLTCPPSRINLTSADLASFDRRWTARQSARRDAENVQLGQGPARHTRLAFVPAAANRGRQRAESCSSQATIHTTEDDDAALHSTNASPAGRNDLPSLGDKSNSSRATATRIGISSPLKIQSEGIPGPARSPTRPPPALDFPIYEDPPLVQAFVEGRYFQQHRDGPAHDLDRIRPATSNLRHERAAAPPPVADQAQIPTLLYPALDPGAPVFVPRMRFGSTTSLSDHDSRIVAEASAPPRNRDQITANLRIRSSFERNTQHSSRSNERHSVISDSSVSLVPTDGPQARRRSRNNDQNAALQRPLLGFDRYPAVRPPAVAFASRRNGGSQRQDVFPRRRSSRQHLIEFERSRRSQEARQQNRSTHLAVPGNDGRRPVSPAASTSSRSTPNLLQPPSAPYIHTRSSSLSSSRSNAHHGQHIPARRPRKSGATVSESSGLIEEILLQRDSPLDRIIQKCVKYASRPRSVGRSFERPPGGRARPSLLSGDLFRQDPANGPEDDLFDTSNERPIAQPSLKYVETRATIERPPASSPTSPRSESQTPHKRHPTIEDPVALALALPSPEVPSSPMSRSSPVVSSSPQLPSTPILRSGPKSPLAPKAGTSAASKSPHSRGSLTPSVQSLAAAVTPRVPVYNDNHPTTHQPQTPADIARSTRRARGRSNTTSTQQGTHSAARPSPSLAPPERHPHRHTFPSTAPEVTVGMTPVRMTATVETTSAIRPDSVLARVQQRSSNSSENDIEGNLDGLEQDRRVWMRRREDGSLDVTPPREGRFERYLS